MSSEPNFTMPVKSFPNFIVRHTAPVAEGDRRYHLLSLLLDQEIRTV